MPEFALGILITWRLAALLTKEAGPFDVLLKFRIWVGVYSELDPDRGEICKGANEVAQMLCCFWCTSVWCAALVALLLEAPALHLLAYSAGAIVLWELIHGTR